jgi:hypothetical protein
MGRPHAVHRYHHLRPHRKMQGSFLQRVYSDRHANRRRGANGKTPRRSSLSPPSPASQDAGFFPPTRSSCVDDSRSLGGSCRSLCYWYVVTLYLFLYLLNFCQGCGIGVLIRMIWVMTVLTFRAIRGTNEEQDSARYEYEEVLIAAPVLDAEEIFVAPPEYTDEKVELAALDNKA